jgi:hypothetical protein
MRALALLVLAALSATALRPLRPLRLLRAPRTLGLGAPAGAGAAAARTVAAARKRSPLDDLLNNPNTFRPDGPGGGGFNLVPALGLGLFFAFPGFFLNALNGLFLAFFVLPPLVGFGFNLWAKRAILQAPCPNCGAVAAGMKSQGFTQCFSCGQELSLTTKGDAWRLRSKYEDPIAAAAAARGRGGPASDVIDVDATDVSE